MNPLASLTVQHRFHQLESLPDNPATGPGRNALFSQVTPTFFEQPHLIARSDDCLAQLGLPPEQVSDAQLLAFFGQPNPLFKPLAQKYTGHQFGVYNPQLGDGRGLLLGEVSAPDGTHWDLHLKGAGLTPYSRMGDGRAVLRSTLREYLASEAMYHLGVPTTRALCVIGSDEPVQRETLETGAMLVRVARTHIRFGHFEYLFHSGQHDLLNDFIQFTLDTLFPDLNDNAQPVAALFNEIVTRTANMLAHWQALGFCHGVMNTDNFSITGDTFDYGPYAFMDAFDPGHVCNHSDWEGRYAFNKQMEIGLWNLNCLAHAFSGVLSRETLVAALKRYQPQFHQHYTQCLRDKFGLTQALPEDDALMGEFLSLLAHQGVDYARAFRALSHFSMPQHTPQLVDEFTDRDALHDWLSHYRARLKKEPGSDDARHARMLQHNPKYILRNYLAQQVIEQAQQGHYAPLHELAEVLRHPFDEQPRFEHYANLPPDWGKALEISCSS